MKRVAGPLLYCLIALYPVLVFLGLQNMQLQHFAIILLSIALLRLWLLKDSLETSFLPVALALTLFLIALYSLTQTNDSVFLYYPVMVNIIMLCFFGGSLLQQQTVVERIARLTQPDLPASGIAYTRKVTIVWCIFFAANGAVALWTVANAGVAAWALYNGAISYCLMGTLFLIEWLVRRRVTEGAA